MKKTITKVVDVNTADDLAHALADVHATPFGNVGQHIGYRITQEAVRNSSAWDLADQLNMQLVNERAHHRIDASALRGVKMPKHPDTPVDGAVWIDGISQSVDLPKEKQSFFSVRGLIRFFIGGDE